MGTEWGVRLTRAIHRSVDVLRAEGWTSLFLRTLQELRLYRRLILIQVPLTDPISTPPASIPLSSCLLDHEDLHEYRAFRPDADPAETGHRLDQGHWCFTARHQGRIVSAVWVAIGTAMIPYLERDLMLAPDQAYAYDSYTVPELRGMAVASVRSDMMRRTLRRKGVKLLLGAVLPENRAARRRAEKRQHKEIGVIGYWRLGHWRRDFLRWNGNNGARA
jgi:hypothetical protein